MLFFVAATACTVVRNPAPPADHTCTACHGDASRDGGQFDQAAPPFDLHGNADVRFPGVGAHQRHLVGSDSFPKVACTSCHLVPAAVLSPGHDNGTTDVTVATLDGGMAYLREEQTCSNSACHLVASGVWTRPRTSSAACGSCHGIPPLPPHPQGGSCTGCHGPLSAQTHVDGQVTRVPESCDACHGSDATGAPPLGLDGGTSPSQRGVGAHQAHLSGGQVSRPVPCDTCHEVPAAVVTANHPNGGPAQVKDIGFDAESGSCANACHAGTRIAFTRTGPLGCTDCHGHPPAAPHPQFADCDVCHPPVDAAHRDHHVDGQVEVSVPAACDTCHGSAANAAPPRSLDAGTLTTQAGVGAHQAHLVGRGLARPVPCSECHPVPGRVIAPGHVDGRVDVVFSGVAVNGALTPVFIGGTCSSVACHDLSAYTGGTSGGGDTPVPIGRVMPALRRALLATVPPPAPHPARSDCGTCHRREPELHVNGHLDFQP